MARAASTHRSTIGILGHGRFGRALGELLLEAGFPVRAYDSAPSVRRGAADAAVCVGSPEELASECQVLILAVPVPKIRAALGQIRPHLSAEHLVLDVASVKLGPERAMTELLGADVPWVATHPLFGPTSLAMGERPLRVVVCPNPMHPQAVDRVRELYTRAGCEVIEKDAKAHDQEMAESHALAYFIAKGLLDAELGVESSIAPPSARAILHTVEAVRSDAGHLFSALHRENPYAAGARSRFLEALGQADARLSAEPDPGEEPSTAQPEPRDAEIPDLGAASPELREVRELIDDLDQELVALLARRGRLAHRASAAKSEGGLGVRDERREQALRARRREWAIALDLDPSDVDSVFKAILDFSRRLQFRQRAR